MSLIVMLILVLALASFVAAAAGANRLNFTAIGLALLTLAELLGSHLLT